MADKRRLARTPLVESLEGRALLSHLPSVPHPSAVEIRAIKTDPAAVAAIMGALNGGSGAEWASLIRKQVRSPQSVIGQFVTGRISSYATAGVTFRTPAVQPAFTGAAYDQLLPTIAGAAVYKNNVFELASIMRGEFRDPNTSYYVFAIDRGAGSRIGPVFASRPGLVADSLVTITVGPYGSSATGKILDLTNNTTQDIDASRISIKGSTLRVFLNTSQFPTTGAALAKYRFAMWTQTQLGNDIANVAGFSYDGPMTPIAVQKTIAAKR